MKSIFLIITLVISSSLFSQEKYTLRSEVTYDRDTVGALDPLVFNFNIFNLCDTNINIFYSKESVYNYFNVEYKKKYDLQWSSFPLGSNNYEYKYHTPSLTKIQTGQIMASGRIIFSLRDFFDTIEVGSQYEFRINTKQFDIGLNKISNSLKIYPAISNLFVADYIGDDKRVYEYVKNLPEPDFFYQPLHLKYLTFSNDNKTESDYPYLKSAEFIVENFSNSKFTPWVNLYISSIYVKLAKNFQIKSNNDICFKYLEKSKHYLYQVNRKDFISEIQFFIDSIFLSYIDIIYDIYPDPSDIPKNIRNEYFYNKTKK